jgi:DNA polymerase III epsilon subunit-like protein
MIYFLIAIVVFIIIYIARFEGKDNEQIKNNTASSNYQREHNDWTDNQRKPKKTFLSTVLDEKTSYTDSNPTNKSSYSSERMEAFKSSETNEPYYFIFDCETTGLFHIESAVRIVQLAWMILDKDFGFIKEVSYYLNPGMPIPSDATAIHHITDKIVQEQSTPHKDVFINFYADLEKAKWIVAHNFKFDAKHVDYETKEAKIKTRVLLRRENTICTMLRGTDFCKLTPKRYGEYKWPKLEELALSCGFTVRGLHDASVDVRVTGLCLKTMVERNYITKEELEKEFEIPKPKSQESKQRHYTIDIELDIIMNFQELKIMPFQNISEISLNRMEMLRKDLDLKKFYKETHAVKYPLPVAAIEFEYKYEHDNLFRIYALWKYKDGSVKPDEFYYRIEAKADAYYNKAQLEEQNDVENSLKTYIQTLNEDDVSIDTFYNTIHRLSVILRKMEQYSYDVRLLEYAIERIKKTNSHYYGLSLLEERIEKSKRKIKLISPDDLNSLKKLKENLRTKIAKAKNRLEFQSERKEDVSNPIPEGDQRSQLLKIIASMELQKETIEKKIKEIQSK